jgi:hypothetical protein
MRERVRKEWERHRHRKACCACFPSASTHHFHARCSHVTELTRLITQEPNWRYWSPWWPPTFIFGGISFQKCGIFSIFNFVSDKILTEFIKFFLFAIFLNEKKYSTTFVVWAKIKKQEKKRKETIFCFSSDFHLIFMSSFCLSVCLESWFFFFLFYSPLALLIPG